MPAIPRKPVPESRHSSLITQESDQAQSGSLTSHPGVINLDVGEASAQLDGLRVAGEPVGVHATEQTSYTNTVDDLSEDDDSTLDSSVEPPPAYEIQPPDVDIDQDGFHAQATAACESAFSSMSD